MSTKLNQQLEIFCRSSKKEIKVFTTLLTEIRFKKINKLNNCLILGNKYINK